VTVSGVDCAGATAADHLTVADLHGCGLRASTDAALGGGRHASGMASVLVAYASKRGSTAEIAAAIARTLREAGHQVDCASVDAVEAVGPYDAVVLGSAVYMKRWRGDARRFLRRHADELGERALWVFSSGPAGEPNEKEEDWAEPRRTIEQAEKLGARDHVVFGGSLPKEPHGFVEKGMVKNTPPEFRDRRDWDEIRGWAERIASDLDASG
jgi:menaquinone-dependent protoporphyrinogen oxidase